MDQANSILDQGIHLLFRFLPRFEKTDYWLIMVKK